MTFRPDTKQKKDQNIQRDTKPYNMSDIKMYPIYLHAFVLIETRHKICSTSETTFYLFYYYYYYNLSCLAWKYVAFQKQNGLQKIFHVESRTINNKNILFYILHKESFKTMFQMMLQETKK